MGQIAQRLDHRIMWRGVDRQRHRTVDRSTGRPVGLVLLVCQITCFLFSSDLEINIVLFFPFAPSSRANLGRGSIWQIDY